MFLVLVAGILVVFDLSVEVELRADLGDRLRELDDGDRPGDLVVHVDPVVAGVALFDQADEALDGVFEAHHRLALFAFAVHRDRVPRHGLRAEAVDDRAEVVVEVEPRRALVVARLRGLGAVDDGGPHLAHREVELRLGEPHVRGVERLRLVVPAAAHRRERHLVFAALPFDFEAALRDGEVRRAVDPGRRRLDEVSVRQARLVEPVEQVQRHRDVVALGVQRALAVDRRVGRAGLGGRVKHGVRLVGLQQLEHEVAVGEVAFHEAEVLDASESLLGIFDPRRGDAAGLGDPVATREVVDADDPLVESVGQSQRGRPSEVAVGTGE